MGCQCFSIAIVCRFLFNNQMRITKPFAMTKYPQAVGLIYTAHMTFRKRKQSVPLIHSQAPWSYLKSGHLYVSARLHKGSAKPSYSLAAGAVKPASFHKNNQ